MMVQRGLVDLSLRRWVCRCRAGMKRKERLRVRGGKGEGFKYFLAMKLETSVPPDAPLTPISQYIAWAGMARIVMMS